MVPTHRILPRSFCPREPGPRLLDHLRTTERLISPILLRPVPQGLEVVAGDRRFRAVRTLRWESVPAYVLPIVAEPRARLLFIADNQAARPSAWDFAESLLVVWNDEVATGSRLTQERLALLAGCSEGLVCEALRVARSIDAEVRRESGAERDPQTLRELPRTALLEVATATAVAERVRLLRVALEARAQGKAATPAVREAKRPKGPVPELPHAFDCSGSVLEGTAFFRSNKPLHAYSPAEAREALTLLAAWRRDLMERATSDRGPHPSGRRNEPWMARSAGAERLPPLS
jgi:ParB-like chromosome segregation protein Spo0J